MQVNAYCSQFIQLKLLFRTCIWSPYSNLIKQMPTHESGYITGFDVDKQQQTMDTTRKKRTLLKMAAKSFSLSDKPKELSNLHQNPHELKQITPGRQKF